MVEGDGEEGSSVGSVRKGEGSVGYRREYWKGGKGAVEVVVVVEMVRK